MGKVGVIYKVYPSEDVNVDELVERIKTLDHVADVRKEPLAFGLYVIKVLAVFEESPGDFEEKLKGLEGVNEVEAGEASLL